MSKLFTGASINQIATILDLFPVTALRKDWEGMPGVKEELCQGIAGTRDFSKILEFLLKNFSLCKQHIYIFDNKSGLKSALTVELPKCEIALEVGTDFGPTRLYFYRYEVEIIIREPLQIKTVDFILPVRIDYREDKIIIRFVTFEKDIHSFFREIEVYIPRKSEKEKEKAFIDSIRIATLDAKLNISPTDLHQGIKTLWNKDFMDSHKVKYNTDHSVDSKTMNERKGIRKHNLAEYERIKDSKFVNTLFETVATDDYPPIVFTVDPSKGFISFGRYTERVGDSDYVVNQILEHNK